MGRKAFQFGNENTPQAYKFVHTYQQSLATVNCQEYKSHPSMYMCIYANQPVELTSVSLMISPLLRQSFLLSSSTVFMLSIHTASTGPSNTYHFFSALSLATPWRTKAARIPSVLHTREAYVYGYKRYPYTTVKDGKLLLTSTTRTNKHRTKIGRLHQLHMYTFSWPGLASFQDSSCHLHSLQYTVCS